MKTRLAIITLCLFALPALAGTRAGALADALDEARAAADEVKDAHPACRQALAPSIDALVRRLRELQDGASDAQVKSALASAEDAADAVRDACTGDSRKRVAGPLEGVVAHLEAALGAAGPPPAASAPATAGRSVLGISVNLAGGLGGLFGGGSSTTRASSDSHASASQVSELNGRRIDGTGDGRKTAQTTEAGFGATCSRNTDCASNTCFVGRGRLGYCTTMCDSFSDCPAFWVCKKAANAPQRICMQNSR